MTKVRLNEWSVSGEVFYLKELEGEFAASVKVRGIAKREAGLTSQILEFPCLIERKVYEDAKSRGFSLYKDVNLSGHIESWARENDRKGNMKIMFIADYVMDIQ